MHIAFAFLVVVGFATLFPRAFSLLNWLILIAMAGAMTVASAVTVSFLTGGALGDTLSWVLGALVGVPMAYKLWAW